MGIINYSKLIFNDHMFWPFQSLVSGFKRVSKWKLNNSILILTVVPFFVILSSKIRLDGRVRKVYENENENYLCLLKSIPRAYRRKLGIG